MPVRRFAVSWTAPRCLQAKTRSSQAGWGVLLHIPTAARLFGLGLIIGFVFLATAQGQEIGSPAGIKAEQLLPSRYPHVVADMLKYCHLEKGLWVDLGAGKGQVAIPLIEATGNPVVMLEQTK